MIRSPSRRAVLTGALLAAAPFGCDRTSGVASLTVFAAMSLRDALRELATLHQQRTQQSVRFNFAGSHVLARQLVASGGAADLFFSANRQAMAEVEGHGRLVPGSLVEPAGNQLVVVAHRRAALSMATGADLLGLAVRRIAIGDPRAVPAGRYAKRFLESIRIGADDTAWTRLAGSDRLVPTPHVRAALALAEADRGTAALVYGTDARRSRGAHVIYRVPEAGTGPIRYQAAALRDGPTATSAAAFLALTTSPVGAAVLRRHGFRVGA